MHYMFDNNNTRFKILGDSKIKKIILLISKDAVHWSNMVFTKILSGVTVFNIDDNKCKSAY